MLVIKPFNFYVWISLLISLISVLISESLISKFYSEFNGIDIKWAIISASLRQQFPRLLPSVRPLRIIISIWILSCLVLTSSYSGCIYSLMTIPLYTKPIDTVMELANAQRNGEIEVMISKPGIYYQNFKVMNLFQYEL